MSVKAGTRVGSFEVSAPLGAGGMGEVYRARDSKLNRDVALKFLPPIFALDSDRLARFTREAQVLAALNHPNIAAIYGLEDDSAVRVLVLELVEGPTLAERIDRGAIPIDESLAIARQVADALAAAHDQGIVHRDLKPANVKVRADGSVKVLDFGLAKLTSSPDGAAEDPLRAAQSPTVTSPAMTQAGLILGTAAYMSPEQARGRTVGKGADIWAFGCVLYEMLTGRRCFGGEDTTETIAAIVRADPDWSRLPAATPDGVRRLLRRCLVKDPHQRLADIRDARLEIDDARTLQPEPAAGPDRSRRRERLLWSAAVAALAALAAAAFWRGARTPANASRTEMHLEIASPPTTDPVSLALSPDGQHVVFVASSEGRPMLWVRSLVTGASRPIRGTDGAFLPFWSPDSRSLGFFAGERLLRVDLDGGPPRALVGAPVGTGGTWNRDGVILYVVVADAPIRRVSAEGGTASVLPGTQDGPGLGQRFPHFLPDGRHFLYFVAETRGVYLGQLDALERRRLLDADAAAVFAAPGQVLFVREGTLFAQPFDPDRLELSGQPRPVAERVTIDARGAAAVSVSNVGSVVFRTGALNRQRQLMWVDRSGKELGRVGDPDPNNPANPALSPDATRLALSRTIDGNTDIWLVDLNRPVLSRFTFDAMPEIYPVWSPDGTRVAFGRPVIGRGFALHVRSANESGPPMIASNSPPGQVIPLDWSHDGRFTLCRTGDIDKGWDLIGVPADGTTPWFPIAHTAFDERAGQLSPDDRFVAYESNESGRVEIFVQPLDAAATKTQVSNNGGGQVRWRADGRELFYIAPDGRLMSVMATIASDGRRLDLAAPQALFMTRVESVPPGGTLHTFAVSADGRRFLMNTFVEQGGSPIGVIVNRKQD
jgi:serine/threonine protein kinase/Tol biopolymer transport system component